MPSTVKREIEMVNKFGHQDGKGIWDRRTQFNEILDERNEAVSDLLFTTIGNPVGHHFLDVGCGGGILTESLAAEAKHVDGIDLADKALTVAKIHQKISGIKNIDYHYIDIESFAKENHQKFDILTCMEMLEHVPYPAKIIKSCSYAVKDGGDLFFSTINRNIKSFIMAIVGAEYVLNLLPKGTHEYDCLIKPSELEQWSRESGLSLIDLIGVSYNPLTKEFNLTDDVSVNYMMHFKKTG